MARYLVFTLYGPLQAWGEVAVGEVRDSASRPTKSGVLGMVGAALGFERGDDEAMTALHEGFGFAVRVDSVGEALHDYHTTQSPVAKKGAVWPTRRRELGADKLNTILSTRYYRADACYTIALTTRGNIEPERIVAAFREPVHALYLGRRACPPAWPIRPVLVEADDLVGAFDRAPVPEALSWIKPGRQVFFEDARGRIEPLFRRQRFDRLTSSRRRSFGKRTEHEGRLPAPQEE